MTANARVEQWAGGPSVSNSWFSPRGVHSPCSLLNSRILPERSEGRTRGSRAAFWRVAVDPHGWNTGSAVRRLGMQFQTKRIHDLEDGVETRTAFAGERFVKTFT